jgi:hypothetical protein
MRDDVAMKYIFRHRSHMMPIWIGIGLSTPGVAALEPAPFAGVER